MANSEFEIAFEKVSKSHATNTKTVAFLHHFVFPVIIGILGWASPFLWAKSPMISLGCWLMLLLVYGLSWWRGHPHYDDILDLLNKKLKDEKTIAKNNMEIDDLSTLYTDMYTNNVTSFVLRRMSVAYIKEITAKKGKVQKPDFEEMISEICAPIYLSGDSLFGFEISEKWSVSLYLHHAKNDLLVPVWREKSATHPSNGLGRVWRQGEGHVGKAFIDRRPILTGNANDEGVAQLCRARGSKLAPYDVNAYVSFASIPLTLTSDDKLNPLGILVASSDKLGRFSEEDTAEILMHYSETIAAILELSAIDIDCFIEQIVDKYEEIEGVENVESVKKSSKQ
ncbi:GAF domain-containing protein [Ahrensia sp. 13_GOM-1096m]|uniref:GAF domain-containing protein n=1 Tax=Ahrensia sp. 13_GOM-1096m TaxID=1380380 RepID=UPI00047B041F|nr:GAF domain-containing protein [Ahrensia sp. 13_GOM-1096m]